MTLLSESIQNADWKTEKHVPVIDSQDTVSADQFFDVTLTVGKTISHPNTTEHHIRWIKLFFRAENEKTVYEMGTFEFTVHGESTKGPNLGPAYTNPVAGMSIKLGKSGTLQALAYCNIHGVWESSKEIRVQ